ncbi:hypothetical protein V1264_022047 [Littorina saxatilis]|uniref:Uncharacterized protein n=1 Tax=Littorina saxatilis TaxID=31220 RepID=A0AAN9AJG6_9CAEN
MASKGTKRKRTEMTVQDKVQLLDRFMHSLTAKSVREAATFLDASHSFLYQSINKKGKAHTTHMLYTFFLPKYM